jgi:hypothetical protein
MDVYTILSMPCANCGARNVLHSTTGECPRVLAAMQGSTFQPSDREAFDRARGRETSQGQVVRNIDAFQWTGDLDAFANWFGERMPIDFRNRISVPVHKSQEGKWLGPWLSVWCGNWIIRHEGRCECVTDIVFRNFIAPHYENVAGNKS